MSWKQPFVMSHITMTDPSSWLCALSPSETLKDPTKRSVGAMLLGGCKQRANRLWRLFSWWRHSAEVFVKWNKVLKVAKLTSGLNRDCIFKQMRGFHSYSRELPHVASSPPPYYYSVVPSVSIQEEETSSHRSSLNSAYRRGPTTCMAASQRACQRCTPSRSACGSSPAPLLV